MNLTAWGGAGWDPDADPAAVKYLVAQNGVFRILNTPVGRFQLPWPEPAPEEMEPAAATEAQVTLSVPRIPANVLDTITRRFQAVQPQEHLLNVYWHRTEDWWMIETPAQKATPTSVEVMTPDGWRPRYDPNASELPRVLQIHSHGALPAFFSATDDADEIACGLYAVMGRCDTEHPTLRVRAGMAGQFLALPMDQIFDVTAEVAAQFTPKGDDSHGTAVLTDTVPPDEQASQAS